MRSIKRTIERLPTHLDDLYTRAITRITSFKLERANIGLMALLWMTHAKRPLNMKELQALLAVEYTVGSFMVGTIHPDGLPRKDIILAATCGLLIVDSSGIVRLMRECDSMFAMSISEC